MRNQIELLNSIVVRRWIAQYSAASVDTNQKLLRYQHALLTLAKATQTGNIPAKTLPITQAEEYSLESPVVLQQFARFINCQSKVNGLPTPFYDLQETTELQDPVMC